MTPARITLALSLAALLSSCAPQTRAANLRADTRLMGGSEATVKMEVPGTWYQTTNRPDKAEFVGADNFSRASVTATPVLAGDRCVDFARRGAEDAAAGLIRGNKDVKVDYKGEQATPEVVDFSMTVPGNPPGPTDRFVVGRAICRDGALVVATCSVGVKRPENREVCQRALASLRIEPVGAVAKQEIPEGMNTGK